MRLQRGAGMRESRRLICHRVKRNVFSHLSVAPSLAQRPRKGRGGGGEKWLNSKRSCA